MSVHWEDVLDKLPAESLRAESIRQKLAKRSSREAQIVRARKLGLDRTASTQWSDNTSSDIKRDVPKSYLNKQEYTMADFIAEVTTAKKRVVRRTTRVSRLLHEQSTVQPEIRDSYKHLTLADNLTENQRARSIVDAIRTGRDSFQKLLVYCAKNAGLL